MLRSRNLKSVSIELAKTICVIGVASIMTACSPDASETTNSASSKPTAKMPTAEQLALPSTPIDRDELFGRVTVAADPIDECPWLSDETAWKMVKTSKVLVRRQVSNFKCVWNENPGFEISVIAEPLEISKPVGDRAYNLDSPPELREQTGPGANAVALFDKTWDESKPLLFGYSFEQNDMRFFLKATGLQTDLLGMRAAADEVAERFAQAKKIEPQYFEAKPSFDACRLWPLDTLLKVFAVEGEAAPQPMGDTGCTYQLYVAEPRETIQIDLTFYTTPLEAAALTAKGYVEDSEIGAIVKFQQREDDFGFNDQLAVLLTDGMAEINVRSGTRHHQSAVKKLAQNLVQRTK